VLNKSRRGLGTETATFTGICCYFSIQSYNILIFLRFSTLVDFNGNNGVVSQVIEVNVRRISKILSIVTIDILAFRNNNP
jgi:hypothetical protein